ncbi:MAG: hypothetical protein M1831_003852 [Alyxoria varia]|nr:MAG: hypothetical protein M1831_003852 [Alyxoria varia]
MSSNTDSEAAGIAPNNSSRLLNSPNIGNGEASPSQRSSGREAESSQAIVENASINGQLVEPTHELLKKAGINSSSYNDANLIVIIGQYSGIHHYFGVRIEDDDFKNDIVRETIAMGNAKIRTSVRYAFLAPMVKAVWEKEYNSGRFDSISVAETEEGNSTTENGLHETENEEREAKRLRGPPTVGDKIRARLENYTLLRAMLKVFVLKTNAEGLREALRRLPLPIGGLLAIASE